MRLRKFWQLVLYGHAKDTQQIRQLNIALTTVMVTLFTAVLGYYWFSTTAQLAERITATALFIMIGMAVLTEIWAVKNPG